MQEKKNKRLLIVLVVLLLATTLSYVLLQEKDTVAVDKARFLISDLENADRIVLARKTDTVRLSFNGTLWTVNEKYQADANLVKVLFATLKQLEPKRPISPSVYDSLERRIQTAGTTITIVTGGETIGQLKSVGNDAKTQTVLGKEGETELFLVTIPGYRVYVAGIFELNEGGWRDKRIFGFHWSNFQSLAVHYPTRKAGNFDVASQNGVFGVKDIVRTDTVKLASYMDRLLSLTADEFVSTASLRDSLLRTTPDATFTVTDIAQRRHSLAVFLGPGERALGLVNGNEPISLHQKKLRPLLRSKEFFLAR